MTLIKGLMHLSAAAIAATLAACTNIEVRERELLESVPADLPLTMAADLDKLLKSAGCSSQRGSITLSQPLAQALARIDADALVGSLALHGSVVDLSWVVGFTTSRGEMMATALLRTDISEPDIDPNAAEHDSPVLGSLRCSQQADGVAMAWNGRQAWLAEMPVPEFLHCLDSLVREADRLSIAAVPELRAFFEGDAVAKGRCDFGIVENPFGDDFDALLWECRLSDRSISATAWCESGYAKVDPLAYLQPIDPNVLQVMPPGTVLAAAAGFTPNSIDVVEHLSKSLPAAQRIIAGAVLGVANDEGGTVAVGLAPGGSAETIRQLTFEHWLAKAILPTDEEMAEAALTIIDNLAPDLAFGEADSAYISVMNFDPYYYECTADMRPARLPGARLAVMATVPYRSQVMKAFKLGSGYSFQAVCIDSCAQATLSLLGPANYILPALAKTAISVR